MTRAVMARLTAEPGRPTVGPLPFQGPGVNQAPEACGLAPSEGLNLRVGEQAQVRLPPIACASSLWKRVPLVATSAMVAKPTEKPRKMPPIKIARPMALSPLRLNFKGQWGLMPLKIKLVRPRPQHVRLIS